jgi:hypothetical protein
MLQYMNKIIFVVAFLQVLIGGWVNQASASEVDPEVIVSGDSWSTLPCFFGSFRSAFSNRHLDVDIHGCMKTSHIGARAENFKTYSAYGETLKHLRANPNAKVVYLSLGGNDMFKYWRKDMSAKEEADLFNYIREQVKNFVDDIHRVRPDVWVLVSGYDNGYLYDHNPVSSYREIYEHMGKPTPLEVNQGFLRFARAMTALRGDHTEFQHHIGLMHYYYGVPEASTPAFHTLAPQLISSPDAPEQAGGVLFARSNKWAMAHIFSYFFDPHHLRPRGFMKLIEHAIDGYIGRWLKGASFDASTFAHEVEVSSGEVSPDLEAEGVQMVQDQF